MITTPATQWHQADRHQHSIDYDAVVVGAGFSGLYMLYCLRDKLNLKARVYEKGSDVGGTWYWNRYPGARCDSESIYYCFSDHFSEALLEEWNWTERYAAQPEIYSYLRWVADRMDLRRDIQFNTTVTGASWDDDNQHWIVTLSDGQVITARFLITAVGCLHVANLPRIPGLETFEGRWFHTGQWPHEPVDFSRRRVAVIGTGATGVQVVPEVATQAAHVYVFQRTPNHDIPARNRPLTSDEMREIKRHYKEIWQRMRTSGFGFPYDAPPRSALSVSPEEREQIYEQAWQKGGFRLGLDTFNDLLFDRESNRTANDFFRKKIAEIVSNPELVDKLAPKYPFFTKRPPLEHGYYEAFNRDNVTLIDVRSEPIEAITPRSIRTTARECEVDDIIFATGFDAMTGAILAIDIRGRNGLTLREKWADGPRTYLGLATSGFPNLFMITGPQSPSVLSNMPVSIELHVDWITECLQLMSANGFQVIEATPEAEDGWVQHHNQVASMTLIPETDSWWVGANISGKPRQLYPYIGGLGNYRKICEEVAQKGYEGFVLT
ncbi:MAG: NAD(P)/FAD-dependent oxidoreductase [Anaerolineales bacterium]|nr:NAD(P)/FAD-dependent oxidoreductase [Anaerolineales bacterium]